MPQTKAENYRYMQSWFAATFCTYIFFYISMFTFFEHRQQQAYASPFYQSWVFILKFLKITAKNQQSSKDRPSLLYMKRNNNCSPQALKASHWKCARIFRCQGIQQYFHHARKIRHRTVKWSSQNCSFSVSQQFC